jgi:hypothetical protein
MVRVSLACNDHRNGEHRGFVEAVQIADVIQLEGARVHCYNEFGHLAIAGLTLPLHGYTAWVGNWCWDQAWLTELDAWRLLEALRRERWHCTEAQAGLYIAWDDGRPLESPLRVALGEM